MEESWSHKPSPFPIGMVKRHPSIIQLLFYTTITTPSTIKFIGVLTKSQRLESSLMGRDRLYGGMASIGSGVPKRLTPDLPAGV